MPARFFQAARSTGNGVPPIQTFIADSAATFIRGAVVFVAADGELEEGGADPAAIAGVAAAAAGSAPGYQAANNPTVVTGRQNNVSVYLAGPDTVFSGRAVNGVTDPVVPTQTLIGESYGILKTSDGTWAVDISDTTNDRVVIVDIDVELNMVLFRFIQANYQFAVAN